MRYERPSILLLSVAEEDILTDSAEQSFKGLDDDGAGTGEKISLDELLGNKGK